MGSDKKNDNKRKRVIALLTRDEMEFLDRIGMDSLFSTGSRLSRIEIMSALVDAAKKLGITGKGAKNKYELLEKIIHMTTSQKEDRQYPRLKKTIRIEFNRLDALKSQKEGVTKDISIGGFSVELDGGNGYNVGDVLEVRFLNGETPEFLVRAIGRIVWKKELSHGAELGVMITYIKKEDAAKFYSYLNEETDNGKNY